ncbi:hypothetical protein ASB65_22915, partial [Agrobacterium tumefaciens str. B6]
MNINRRTILAGAGSAVLATAFVSRARAAQYNYKYANNLPAAHPMNIPRSFYTSQPPPPPP